MMNVAINGFGRIGRVLARRYFANPEYQKNFKLVCINDTASLGDLALSFKYDSTHGTFNGTLSHDENNLLINGQKVPATKETDPTKLPWKSMGVDLVFECTGRFTDREGASKHIAAGAKKVMVSAPAKGIDLTVVMGVNDSSYDASKHHIVSNASCTTNCLAPVAHTIHNKFGILKGLMTTVHSYTSDQRLLDNAHKDPRRGRSAAVNMVPTTTGAAKSVGEVIPALKGKLDGLSVRVPTPNVSFTDVVFQLSKKVSKEEVNEALIAASQGELKGYLAVSDEPLVSSDFNGCPYSSVVDLALTNVVGADESGSLVKVCAWYDNETGFSNRMLDFAQLIARKGV